MLKMHSQAYELMVELLARAPANTGCVLDVGSRDVNGTYRPLINLRNWSYVGIDIEAGPNVDTVVSPYSYPFEDGKFDVVVSGSTLEHVLHPWLWMLEVVRVLRPGGLLAIVTHWQFKLHRHPVDAFRYMPDGMRALFDWTNLLGEYDIRIANATDIVGSAIRQ